MTILGELFKEVKSCEAKRWETPSTFWVPDRDVETLALELLTRMMPPPEVARAPMHQRKDMMVMMISAGRIQINHTAIKVHRYQEAK